MPAARACERGVSARRAGLGGAVVCDRGKGARAEEQRKEEGIGN
jgi:hypothetical protein